MFIDRSATHTSFPYDYTWLYLMYYLFVVFFPLFHFFCFLFSLSLLSCTGVSFPPNSLSVFSKTLSTCSYSPKKNKKARAKRHCSVQKLEGRRGVPAAIKCTICHGSVHLLLHMLWNRKVYKCNKNTPGILVV